MRIAGVCVTLFALLLLGGCGGGGGGSSSSGDGTVVDMQADSLQLSTSLETGTVLSQGGQLIISATVTYDNADGGQALVADGTEVSFSIDEGGGGQITSAATTLSGIATATYSAGTYGGIVSVSGTVAGTEITDSIFFEVATGEPASIIRISAVPETIGVFGSGGVDTSIVTFEVRDAAGNIVPDGRRVDFEIAVSPGGGVALSETEAHTINGRVSVALQSGTTSGPVDIRASYYDIDSGRTLATVVQVVIVSGVLDAKRMSIAAEYHSMDGTINGLEDTITAVLVDRYGNPVPDGTPVSFMTEDGTVGLSSGFDATTNIGEAKAVLRTASSDNLVGHLCTVVAYAAGSESYIDDNGNGVYDDGESITHDMSDPYIDANDNGSFDADTELYVDADLNGQFTAADREFQAQTTVWKNIKILLSEDIGSINLSPSTFAMDAGTSQGFTFNFGDINDNALIGGSTYKIVTSVGTISGALTDFTLADSNGEMHTVSFMVSVPSDEDSGSIEVKVTVTLPDGAQGGGGLSLTDFATGTVVELSEEE
ncbi:MAG: hypothetical protein U9R29_07335 [Thermodesulfobacteriota bacterium]|nr:hypothetical protein [Thermodesulfobacteriota bacterium]